MAKILGLGNALVDILIMLPTDDLLHETGLPKGSMLHVKRNIIDELLAKTGGLQKQIRSGGSAANAIHGLARLGNTTAFIGKTGPDHLGKIFYDDLVNGGIDPKLIPSATETGTAVAFISPDSERSFAVYLGAALELSASDLSEEHFRGYNVLHIEGYLVQNQRLIKKAVKLAKAAGLTVSLDLASYNVVEDNLKFLKRIVRDYVDIVFANEEEALAFTGYQPERAVAEISRHCEIAVVKTGPKGSLVQSGNYFYLIDITPTKVVDTTGAGDLYAAGFLDAVFKAFPIEKCGMAGAILAGNVIRYVGAKIPEEAWPAIVQEIKNL
jgi:sugar/nucleoside kinase (ribokinase family)